MIDFLPVSIAALVSTEFRLRLRSPATWVAVVAFAAGFWFWLPSPDGRAVNLSWETLDGRLQTPRFTSHLVGLACGELSGVILPLLGFYLVAGTIRADRRRGLGQILAATPLPSWAYLLGKTLAHAAYLSLLALIGMVTGALSFLVRGEGTLEPARFIAPTLWVALPMALGVAALAILFDVTPGLRGAGGWVAWFFCASILILALPAILLGGAGEGPREGKPDLTRAIFYDPAAMMGLQQLIQQSLPEAKPESISSGLVLRDKPHERVDWKGVELTSAFRRQRFGTALQALVPLLLALVLFDRFDPAHRWKAGVGWLVRKRAARKPVEAPSLHPGHLPPGLTGSREGRLADLAVAVLEPSGARAIIAEVRMTFEELGRWRWLLLAVAVAPAFLPGLLTHTVLLVIATPILAAAGAREAQGGAMALIRGQPGIPASLLAWKGTALAGFAVSLTLPSALRIAIHTPSAAAGALAGAALLGLLAAACGSVTGGGKLFSGLHVAAIYLALNGLRSGDATGLLHDPARFSAGPPGVLLFAVLACIVGWAAAILENRRLGVR